MRTRGGTSFLPSWWRDPIVRDGTTGQVSGVRGEVYVRPPPLYDEPAYRNTKFPVVELLPGYPGSAKAWFATLDVQEQLGPLTESAEIAPFTLVAPRTTLPRRATPPRAAGESRPHPTGRHDQAIRVAPA